jgi:hypothetical protein
MDDPPVSSQDSQLRLCGGFWTAFPLAIVGCPVYLVVVAADPAGLLFSPANADPSSVLCVLAVVECKDNAKLLQGSFRTSNNYLTLKKKVN